ncbi:hypothetical protein [Pseudonocardia sp. T1-2H]|jgi:uncharacterized protein with NRDE domain|uniref:hypothetical protein n=1 Tax=Pseudonocardia sp. T1-2H TaxID=3128899 RepID=UPI003100D9CC
MITDVDAVARSERDERFGDPSWPGAVIEEVELVVTSRDRAHGRSGRWTGHETASRSSTASSGCEASTHTGRLARGESGAAQLEAVGPESASGLEIRRCVRAG